MCVYPILSGFIYLCACCLFVDQNHKIHHLAIKTLAEEKAFEKIQLTKKQPK